MTLYFITGNANKFKEAKEIFPGIEQLVLDLPEIQDVDMRKIIESKLAEAVKEKPGVELFCEDTSLSVNCLNGLPGPLIKWFLKKLGSEGIYQLISGYEDKAATAVNMIGYVDAEGKMSFFEGRVDGRIVEPRGETNFGWDPIFQPDGYDKTFAEMSSGEKNEISHRRVALNKLKDYLNRK